MNANAKYCRSPPTMSHIPSPAGRANRCSLSACHHYHWLVDTEAQLMTAKLYEECGSAVAALPQPSGYPLMLSVAGGGRATAPADGAPKPDICRRLQRGGTNG